MYNTKEKRKWLALGNIETQVKNELQHTFEDSFPKMSDL